MSFSQSSQSEDILPALHQDLLNYATDLTALDDTACLPSLSKYWLNPHDPKTSPYGVEVCKAMKEYLDTGCDRELMSTYLKQIFQNLSLLGIILHLKFLLQIMLNLRHLHLHEQFFRTLQRRSVICEQCGRGVPKMRSQIINIPA